MSQSRIVSTLFLAIALLVGCAETSETRASAPNKVIKYQVDGTEHVGYVASGAKPGEKKPGVIIVHEWWGHNDYARARADMLANEGYVAMAIDMYGEGKTAAPPDEAGAFAKTAMSDFALAKKRFEKAVEILKSRQDVDADKIVAIGYCFGGAVVLNMARAGMDLDMVASFHGALSTPQKAKPGQVTAKVLVFNGKADPMVKKEDVTSFKKEMQKAKARFEVFEYEGAKHAFTNKEADDYAKKFNLPLGYDAKADQDSWDKFLTNLKSI